MDDIADLQRRIANMVRRGVISEVKLDGPRPSCRVKLGKNTTGWLPVCQWGASKYRQDFHPYAVGDAVTVISEAGDLKNGRVFPGWNTDSVAIPDGDENTHVTTYEDGTEVRYDRAAHALTITLAEGGTYRIVGDGTLDGPVTITDTLTVNGITTLQANTTVAGDFSASGEISDSYGSISQIRVVYNGHHHEENGDGGGTTDPPSELMKMKPLRRFFYKRKSR